MQLYSYGYKYSELYRDWELVYELVVITVSLGDSFRETKPDFGSDNSSSGLLHARDGIESCSLITYNIFFGPHFDDIRYPAILRILEDSNVDFICLQEVTALYGSFTHSSRFLRVDFSSTAKQMHSFNNITISPLGRVMSGLVTVRSFCPSILFSVTRAPYLRS
jgi:hypothetical protein